MARDRIVDLRASQRQTAFFVFTCIVYDESAAGGNLGVLCPARTRHAEEGNYASRTPYGISPLRSVQEKGKTESRGSASLRTHSDPHSPQPRPLGPSAARIFAPSSRQRGHLIQGQDGVRNGAARFWPRRVLSLSLPEACLGRATHGANGDGDGDDSTAGRARISHWVPSAPAAHSMDASHAAEWREVGLGQARGKR